MTFWFYSDLFSLPVKSVNCRKISQMNPASPGPGFAKKNLEKTVRTLQILLEVLLQCFDTLITWKESISIHSSLVCYRPENRSLFSSSDWSPRAGVTIAVSH